MQEIKLGDLKPTRDLLYVKDTVSGFLAIAKSDFLLGQDCNIATQSEICMGDLAQILIDEINPSARIVADKNRNRPEKSEVYRLFGSNEKIMACTDWIPQYDLKRGLLETIQWFKDPHNQRFYKADIYNI
jgi:nucleoside-diphosphate-sugar epimerase